MALQSQHIITHHLRVQAKEEHVETVTLMVAISTVHVITIQHIVLALSHGEVLSRTDRV